MILVILGWQIIRTSERSSEEFVMIYDLWIEQPDVQEEHGDNQNKSKASNLYSSNEKQKGAEDVFEE